MNHLIQTEINGEGSFLVVAAPLNSKEEVSSGYRIAGNKAWGGSKKLVDFKVTDTPFINFIKNNCSSVVEDLKNDNRYLTVNRTKFDFKLIKRSEGAKLVILKKGEKDILFHFAGNKDISEKGAKTYLTTLSDSDLLRYINEYCTKSTIKRIIS